MRRGLSNRVQGAAFCLALCCWLAVFAAASWAQDLPAVPDAPQATTGTASLVGLVRDVGATPVGQATVTLTGSDGFKRQVMSDDDGNFKLDGLPAGTFTLTVTAEGLTTLSAPVVLGPQEQKVLPPFALGIATAKFQVDAISQKEMADEQLKVEEKQRILGVIPNFYVAFDQNAVPLTQTQKLQLAWRSLIDPAIFVGTAIGAGISQGTQTPVEWGQTWKGYGQRYGASYAGAVVGTGLSGVVFPAVFHQDPRYFFKGTGTKKERLNWALKQVLEQRDDKGQWRPAYSNTVGSLSASLVTTAIYPHQTTAWGPTIGEDFGLNLAGVAFGNIMEEFVVPRLPKFKKKTQSP